MLTRIYFFWIAALGDVRGSRDIQNRDYDEIQRAHGSSSDTLYYRELGHIRRRLPTTPQYDSHHGPCTPKRKRRT